MRTLSFNTVNHHSGDDWEHEVKEDQLTLDFDMALSNIEYEQGAITFARKYPEVTYTHSVRAKHITAWCVTEKK